MVMTPISSSPSLTVIPNSPYPVLISGSFPLMYVYSFPSGDPTSKRDMFRAPEDAGYSNKYVLYEPASSGINCSLYVGVPRYNSQSA